MWDKEPVAQAVASRLQGMIRSGELKAGDKLPSQRTLAGQLCVSRPTLREALLTLETLGLIRTLPARGTFVLDPVNHPPRTSWRYDGAYDLHDVFQTRLLIEPELCSLAAPVMTDEVAAVLAAASLRFEEAWQKGDLVAHIEADLALHRSIADASPNRILASIYTQMQHLLRETQRQPIPNTDPERMYQSIAEHWAIVEALQARDSETAKRCMHAHIKNTARCAGVSLD